MRSQPGFNDYSRRRRRARRWYYKTILNAWIWWSCGIDNVYPEDRPWKWTRCFACRYGMEEGGNMFGLVFDSKVERARVVRRGSFTQLISVNSTVNLDIKNTCAILMDSSRLSITSNEIPALIQRKWYGHEVARTREGLGSMSSSSRSLPYVCVTDIPRLQSSVLDKPQPCPVRRTIFLRKKLQFLVSNSSLRPLPLPVPTASPPTAAPTLRAFVTHTMYR